VLLLAELGRNAEAQAELDAVATHDFSDRPRDVSWLFYLCWAADATALLRDVRRAALLYEILLPHAHRLFVVSPALTCDGAVERALGRLAVVLGREDAAAQHFERALITHEQLGARPFLAHTQVELAEVLLAQGRQSDASRARELLDRAGATVSELGMAPLAERVADLSRSVGLHLLPARDPVRPTMSRSADLKVTRLSGRERQVATLIARGYSNREISEELHITRRTVESHVTTIFNRLGLVSRTQLAVWAIGHGLQPSEGGS
jgi:DNA-binding CsgD family transcriptional regulator